MAIPGKDITLTLDSKLQQYGEALMANKRGGIVAIEPATGEILAMVSTPTYNPNLLVGRQRSKNYTKLYYDEYSKPLYDRSLLAQYPPGSPFKIINALVALQERVITPESTFFCHGGFKYGRGAKVFIGLVIPILQMFINELLKNIQRQQKEWIPGVSMLKVLDWVIYYTMICLPEEEV